MPWECRQRGGQYYYRSVRRDGRPRKLYLGNGKAAAMLAQLYAEQQQQRRANRVALRAEQGQVAQADVALVELRTVVHLLVKAVLLVQGYHLHRGKWRRWRRRHEQEAQGSKPRARTGGG